MPKQPPHVNGIMELTEEQTTVIRGKLQSIVDAFVDTDDAPVCDTFYIVSTYNRHNVGEEINGDTAEFLLNV